MTVDRDALIRGIVKGLVWEDRSGFWTAQTPWGRYAMGQRGEIWIWAWNGDDQPAESKAAAQAAAEADYRARISAALDMDALVELVGALERIAKGEMTLFDGVTGEAYTDDMSGAHATDIAAAALARIGGRG